MRLPQHATDDRSAVLSSLADETRRRIVHRLSNTDGEVILESLAIALADEDEDARDIAAELHHCHLPLLDDVGVIEYDCTQKRISKAEAFDRFARLLSGVSPETAVASE